MRGKKCVLMLAGIVAVSLLGCPSGPGSTRVFYVDLDNTSGIQNGLTWNTAYAHVAQAMAAAAATYQECEIWVAEGDYQMGGAKQGIPTTLAMASDVDLYGGFVGIGAGGYETARDQRDWETHEVTILGVTSGATDTGVVMTGADDAILDGFTVYAYPHDAKLRVCLLNDGVSPTVQNCTFEGYRTNLMGWEACGTVGVINNNSSATVTDCTFLELGLGVRSMDSTGAVSNCWFELAAAEWGGGGMYNVRSSIAVSDCTFKTNDCSEMRILDFGGSSGTHDVCAAAMYNEACSPTVTNCLFDTNDATPYAGDEGIGGAVLNVHGAPSFTGCTFTGNSATDAGGAVCCAGPAKARFGGAVDPAHGLTAPDFTGVAGVTYGATFTNCAFTNNSATTGGAVCSMDGAVCTFSGCTFTGNSSDYETL